MEIKVKKDYGAGDQDFLILAILEGIIVTIPLQASETKRHDVFPIRCNNNLLQ